MEAKMEHASRDLPAVLFFDINETLLDLHPLKESINNVLLEQEGAALWFTTCCNIRSS
jgi:hypothetical protein